MEQLGQYFPFILLIGVFYLFLIRPQQQRNKRQKEMMDSLAEGNEVMTAGGIMGKITSVNDSIIRLEIAPNVIIAMQKTAVTTLLPPGTLEAPEQLPPAPPSCCA